MQSNFPHKLFEGVTYKFDHLLPITSTLDLNKEGTSRVSLYVSFSFHCFTEEIDLSRHLDHHRYTHASETRAFDKTRYRCSLQLPSVVESLVQGKIYRAKDNNYTYVAQIALDAGRHPYSIFFSLKQDSRAIQPTLRMVVQSAYIKPLAVTRNAQNWRFISLAGQIAGVFAPPALNPRPKKKKAP